jgi:hypothetical protein
LLAGHAHLAVTEKSAAHGRIRFNAQRFGQPGEGDVKARHQDKRTDLPFTEMFAHLGKRHRRGRNQDIAMPIASTNPA